ncbi:MAG: selenium-dependent molybdenum cofactor biosynthesis protein YqeB [Eubacteriales bacterium]|nr:selenium-dependent molybdenum cofactor biosynthesis protein YqeB [Eubacteriales bacterium]
MQKKLVIVRGGGDLATGVVFVLHKAGFAVIILEIAAPSAIRRAAAFSEAVYENEMTVEGLHCRLCKSYGEALEVIGQDEVAMLVDPECRILKEVRPFALVDAILAKKNLGTRMDMSDNVVALGPGFEAGKDAHLVVETMRGHNLGRIYDSGFAIANTGVPGLIAGHSSDRVIHAEADGVIHNLSDIGDIVAEGQPIAVIRSEDGTETLVRAGFTGLLRGLIRDGYAVDKGLKIADIDARTEQQKNCFTISDKARSLGGSTLCAIMSLACRHGQTI